MTFSFLASSIIILTSIGINNYFKSNKTVVKELENEYIIVNVYGAVMYPGDYELKKDSVLFDLIKLSKLKSGADLSGFNLHDLLKNKQKIYIPFFKNKRISIKDIKSANDLISLGIKKNIAIIIFDFLKKGNNKITWDDLENIYGVGEATIKILKENIIL